MVHPIIDAHQHVWDPDRAAYDWLGPELTPINRAIGIDELLPSLRRCGVTGTVLVQSADNREDTDLMLEVAAAHDEVLAVVAYVPLERPDDAAQELDALREHPLVVGFRTLIHNQADPDWLLRPDVDESLGMLEQTGMTFDVVAGLPRHLEVVSIVSERHPDLRLVIDHLAKPPIGLASRDPWWQLIARVAENPRVSAKVSGLYAAPDAPESWSTEVIRPYFDRAVEVFGTGRLMYGGDWPISILEGDYERVWRGLSPLFGGLDSGGRDEVLGETSARFYGIDPARIEAAGALWADDPIS